jgi:hypothetical protein
VLDRRRHHRTRGASNSQTIVTSGGIEVAAATVEVADATFVSSGSVDNDKWATFELRTDASSKRSSLRLGSKAGLLDLTALKTLDLGGATMDVAAGGVFANVSADGSLENGTVAVASNASLSLLNLACCRASPTSGCSSSNPPRRWCSQTA